MSKYYYQTRNGKTVRVRKGLSASLKRDLRAGTSSAAASAGFVIGTGTGLSVAKALGKVNNPVVKTITISTGAIAGSTVATILASRVIDRQNLKD